MKKVFQDLDPSLRSKWLSPYPQPPHPPLGLILHWHPILCQKLMQHIRVLKVTGPQPTHNMIYALKRNSWVAGYAYQWFNFLQKIELWTKQVIQMLENSTHTLFIAWFCYVKGFLVICWPICTYSTRNQPINHSIKQSFLYGIYKY